MNDFEDREGEIEDMIDDLLELCNPGESKEMGYDELKRLHNEFKENERRLEKENDDDDE